MGTKIVFCFLLPACLFLASLQAVPIGVTQQRQQLISNFRTHHDNIKSRLPSQNLFLNDSSINFKNASQSRRNQRLAMRISNEGKNLFVLRTMNASIDWDSGENQKNMLIWKVENGEIVKTNIKNVREFQSEKNYVILEGKSEAEPENMNIHYWIGKDSSDADVGDAVSYAVELDSKIHRAIQIRRELEGHESSSFKALFKQNSAERGSSIEVREDKQGDANAIRMFLIEGRDQIQFKEVEVSSHYVQEDDKCFVLVLALEKVYAYCGNATTQRQKIGANEIFKIMLRRVPNKFTKRITLHRSVSSNSSLSKIPDKELKKLKALLTEFQRISKITANEPINNRPYKFKPKEVRRILDQTIMLGNYKEWFDIKVKKIYENEDGIVQEENMAENRIPLKNLNLYECYVIDSRSNVGVFVWMGNLANVNVRMGAARSAELRLREKKYDPATPITFIEQGQVPPSVQTVQKLVHVLNPLTDDDEKSATESEASRGVSKLNNTPEIYNVFE